MTRYGYFLSCEENTPQDFVDLKVCGGKDAAQARKTMHRLWPNDYIPGEAAQLLPRLRGA